MNNLSKAFENGKALIGFVTAGDPSLSRSEEYVLQMARAGADLIEIGVPFSDPVAESSAVQLAYLRALEAGVTMEGIFTLIERVRKEAQTPLALLSYFNPVYRYGCEAFFARCKATDVGGVLVPDLPLEEQDELRVIADRHGVALINLLSPASGQRVAEIAPRAKGFLCAAGSPDALPEMLRLARQVTALPVVVDFGVQSAEQALQGAQIADGVVVGEAIAVLAAQYGDAAGPRIYEYVANIKSALEAIK